MQLDTERDGVAHVSPGLQRKADNGLEDGGSDQKSIHVDLAGPVWDGNLWGETFVALPLTPGASLKLPTYQYDSGLGTFYVDTVGERSESTPAGKVQAWRIKAGLSRTEQVKYVVATQLGLEIAYRAGPSAQQMGGDCTGAQIDRKWIGTLAEIFVYDDSRIH